MFEIFYNKLVSSCEDTHINWYLVIIRNLNIEIKNMAMSSVFNKENIFIGNGMMANDKHAVCNIFRSDVLYVLYVPSIYNILCCLIVI